MALTVEELQIVLSCDASTAQKVLDKMDATVKAYTEKFQKYFQTKSGDVKPLDGVAKQIDKGVKDIKAKAKEVQKAMDFTPKYKGTGLTYADVGRTAAEKAAQGRAAAEAYNREFAKAKPGGVPSSKILGLGANAGGDLKAVYNQAKNAGLVTDVLKEKIFRAYTAMRDLGKEYAKVAQEQGPESAAGQKSEQAYLKSIYAVDKYTQQLAKAVAKEEELAQKQQDAADRAAQKAQEAAARLQEAANTAQEAKPKFSSLGSAIKKAFQSSLLGRFLKQLGRTMLRMAAMKLIRGTIQGVSEGFEYLSKKSSSCAKAMNTIKGAGNSIKMSLGMALMPIVKALAPVFVWLAGAINSAAQAVANFLAVLTGQSTYTAVGFSDDMDGVSDSIDGAGKSAKRALAAFDELNVIGQQGGGGGSNTPDYSGAYEWVEAQSDWAELFASGDFFGIGAKIGDALGNISKKITEFLKKPEIQNFGKNLADLLNGSVSKPENWENFGETIGTTIGTATKWIIDFFDNADWPAVEKAINAFLDGVWEGFKKELAEYDFSFDKPYWEVIIDKLFGEGSWESVTLPNIWEMLFGSGGSVDGGISIDATVEVGLIKKTWTTVADWVNKNIGGAVDKGVGLVKSGWDTVSGWVASAVNFGKTVVAKGVGLAKSGWTFVSDWVKARLGSTTVAKGVGLLKSGWTFVSDWVKARLGNTVVAKGVGLAKSGWTFVSDWVKARFGNTAVIKGVGLAKSSWDTVSQWVKDRLGSVSVSKAIGLAKNGWKTVTDWIKQPDAFGNAISKAIGLAKNGWATVQTWIQDGRMGNAVNKGIGLVKNAWTTVQAWIQDGKLGNAVNKGIGLINNGWKTVADWIKNGFLGGIVSKGISLAASLVNSSTAQTFINTWNALEDKALEFKVTLKENIKNAWNKVVKWINRVFGTSLPEMAKGGIAYGQTTAIIGEYSGAKSNPEVVAPLSTLVGLLEKSNVGSGNSKDSMTREQANTMIRLLQRIEQKENVIYPSVELGQVVDRSKALYART